MEVFCNVFGCCQAIMFCEHCFLSFVYLASHVMPTFFLLVNPVSLMLCFFIIFSHDMHSFSMSEGHLVLSCQQVKCGLHVLWYRY